MIEPIFLKPAYKDYLWGGDRLIKDFGKSNNIYPLAETWECSTHADGLSITDNGEYLIDILKKNPNFLGSHPRQLMALNGLPEFQLPILIKLIDANKDLSVQVHPDDLYALKNEKSLGKSELWYILDADKDANIVYGFHRNTNENEVIHNIKNNSILDLLNKIYVKKDDVFFIEPGIIHALGKGMLVAEIQENSNITYRLYDYNRRDSKGEKRTLHIEKALKVINYTGIQDIKQPLRVLNYYNGMAYEVLYRCQYFMVERLIVNTENKNFRINFTVDNTSFQVMLCISGCGVILFNNKTKLFFKGDCFFLPANCCNFSIHGVCQLLKISC